jgi:hypothetical protein
LALRVDTHLPSPPPHPTPPHRVFDQVVLVHPIRPDPTEKLDFTYNPSTRSYVANGCTATDTTSANTRWFVLYFPASAQVPTSSVDVYMAPSNSTTSVKWTLNPGRFLGGNRIEYELGLPAVLVDPCQLGLVVANAQAW